MLQSLKSFFTTSLSSSKIPESPEIVGDESVETAKIAACALLIEIARSDNHFSDDERTHITNILQADMKIPKEMIDEYMAEAMKRAQTSIDYWQFANMINERFTYSQKLTIMEMIWKIIYADSTLTCDEDYLVHKFAQLLKIEHRDMIACKINVKQTKEQPRG